MANDNSDQTSTAICLCVLAVLFPPVGVPVLIIWLIFK
jgi:hypothetical protein